MTREAFEGAVGRFSEGVCYRQGPITVADYDECIAEMQDARRALAENDNMGCAVCTDGHATRHCHHNALFLARQWTEATSVWTCFHCGFVATNAEEGREHFGLTERDDPACQDLSLVLEGIGSLQPSASVPTCSSSGGADGWADIAGLPDDLKNGVNRFLVFYSDDVVRMCRWLDNSHTEFPFVGLSVTEQIPMRWDAKPLLFQRLPAAPTTAAEPALGGDEPKANEPKAPEADRVERLDAMLSAYDRLRSAWSFRQGCSLHADNAKYMWACQQFDAAFDAADAARQALSNTRSEG